MGIRYFFHWLPGQKEGWLVAMSTAASRQGVYAAGHVRRLGKQNGRRRLERLRLYRHQPVDLVPAGKRNKLLIRPCNMDNGHSNAGT